MNSHRNVCHAVLCICHQKIKQVLVHTPSHDYTVGELTELFKATGDMQAVRHVAMLFRIVVALSSCVCSLSCN